MESALPQLCWRGEPLRTPKGGGGAAAILVVNEVLTVASPKWGVNESGQVTSTSWDVTNSNSRCAGEV